MNEKDLPEGDKDVAEVLPDDRDPEILDGMAKLELLRQMEDIERLGE